MGFKKLRRLQQQKHRFKNLTVGSVFCDYSRVSFHFIGTIDFHVKAADERLPATSKRCCRNIKYENCTRRFLADYACQRNRLKCVPPVQHDYFFPIQPIGASFLIFTFNLSLPSSFLKFSDIVKRKRKRVFFYLSIKNQTVSRYEKAEHSLAQKCKSIHGHNARSGTNKTF